MSTDNPIDEDSVLNELNKVFKIEDEEQPERLTWVVVSELVMNELRVHHYYTAGPFTTLEDADALIDMLDETSIGRRLIARVVSGPRDRELATSRGMTSIAARGLEVD